MILVRILPPHAASSTILSVDRMDDKGLWQGHINHFFRLPKRQHPPCRRALGGPMSFWLPSNAPWSLGPGRRIVGRGGRTRGEESERRRRSGGAGTTERDSAQRILRRDSDRILAPYRFAR